MERSKAETDAEFTTEKDESLICFFLCARWLKSINMAARCLLSVCASLLLRPVESFTLHPVVSGARAPSLSLCRPPLASAHLRSSRRLATPRTTAPPTPPRTPPHPHATRSRARYST